MEDMQVSELLQINWKARRADTTHLNETGGEYKIKFSYVYNSNINYKVMFFDIVYSSDQELSPYTVKDSQI